MTPLIETIFNYLYEQRLDDYIDFTHYDAYSAKAEEFHEALSALLPEPSRTLLDEYKAILHARSMLKVEAMFQAAYAASKELF